MTGMPGVRCGWEMSWSGARLYNERNAGVVRICSSMNGGNIEREMGGSVFEWLSTLPHCVLYGHPLLAFLELTGNLGTALAYFVIPAAIEGIRRWRKWPLNRLWILFSLFILSCGVGHLTHVMATVTGAYWAYWIYAIVTMFTALISLYTAYRIFCKIPLLFDIVPANEAKELKHAAAILTEAGRWQTLVESMEFAE